jgi:Spy/CpxP family protein refolding chaperone
MKAKINIRFLMLWIIGGALFLLPSLNLAQAKAGSWERLKEQLKIVRDLNDLKLGPEKEAALLAVDQKYAKERKGIVAVLKKSHEDLKSALAAATQDEEKIKNLVSAANSAQDKLFASFKMERDEAMALMTPIQQAQFIMVMGNWYQEMMKRSEMNKS